MPVPFLSPALLVGFDASIGVYIINLKGFKYLYNAIEHVDDQVWHSLCQSLSFTQC